jgi:signal transduction histidine kinase/ActR/RegA family two-component response regulator
MEGESGAIGGAAARVCRRLPFGHRHALPDARRADPVRLRSEIRAASHHPIVDVLLSAVDAHLLVLNEHRQIVAYSGRTAEIVKRVGVLGRRPGEALGCVNAQTSAGCGAVPACESCGALGVILASREEELPVETDWVLCRSSGALELEVRATPVLIEQTRFTVLSLRDVSDERRREALEQIFFHDVLNTVAGLRGWAELLRADPGERRDLAERIYVLSRHIEREVRDHRALMMAERGTLVPSLERLRASQLLADVRGVLGSQFAAGGRRLEVQAEGDLELEADPALLLRVLVNMVRNALEATEAGGAVTVRCVPAPLEHGGVRFGVHNDGAMPPEVQARVFQRSFSTKARHGRGLGTYSMKLLGEGYLGGQVGFVSDAGQGTTFWFDAPLRPPAPTPSAEGREAPRALLPSSPYAAPPAARRRDRVARRRILIIDDDLDVREGFGEYLRSRLGHEVELAADGETGVARARSWRPEIVFCDISLPGVDGYEIARRLRGEPGLRGSTLVAMTGYGGEGAEARAGDAGFDHRCTKPLDLDALEALLDTLPLPGAGAERPG